MNFDLYDSEFLILTLIFIKKLIKIKINITVSLNICLSPLCLPIARDFSGLGLAGLGLF